MKKKREVKAINAINEIQKSIIEATVKFYFDDMDALEPELAIKAYQTIISPTSVTRKDKRRLQQKGILDDVEFIRKILEHPSPQNRSENYPYFERHSDPTMIVYKDVNGKPAFEREGLLGLTARNDKTAPPVTKKAVVKFIKQLVDQKIIEHQKRLGELATTLPTTSSNSQEIEQDSSEDSNELNDSNSTNLCLGSTRYTFFDNDYALERSLNASQQYALRELKNKGLTAQMLLARHDNGHAFDSEHCFALFRLVKDRDYSIQEALAEIEGLSHAQAIGIQDGLTRQDVLPLTYFWHIAALEKLKNKGLTAQMLLARHDNGESSFDAECCFALVNLVERRDYSIQAALAEIEGLSHAQVMGIKDGLTRQDVLPLTHFWHIAALRELKNKGLTAQMLLKRHDNDESFGGDHCFALVNLVKRRGYSIKAAFAEIEGLSSHQASAIEEGLTRQDVLPLTNFWHISALKQLKNKGLTTQMLLMRHGGGHAFDSEHCFALVGLVKDRDYSIQEALAEIEGLSYYQAERIKRGSTRAGLLHDHQTDHQTPYFSY